MPSTSRYSTVSSGRIQSNEPIGRSNSPVCGVVVGTLSTVRVRQHSSSTPPEAKRQHLRVRIGGYRHLRTDIHGAPRRHAARQLLDGPQKSIERQRDAAFAGIHRRLERIRGFEHPVRERHGETMNAAGTVQRFQFAPGLTLIWRSPVRGVPEHREFGRPVTEGRLECRSALNSTPGQFVFLNNNINPGQLDVHAMAPRGGLGAKTRGSRLRPRGRSSPRSPRRSRCSELGCFSRPGAPAASGPARDEFHVQQAARLPPAAFGRPIDES